MNCSLGPLTSSAPFRLPVEDTASVQRHRQRIYRSRLKQGIRVIPVEVPRDVVGCLIADGWLGENDWADARKIGDALNTLHDAWVIGNLACPKVTDK
jgi:hypothetical protein